MPRDIDSDPMSQSITLELYDKGFDPAFPSLCKARIIGSICTDDFNPAVQDGDRFTATIQLPWTPEANKAEAKRRLALLAIFAKATQHIRPNKLFYAKLKQLRPQIIKTNHFLGLD